MTALAYGKGTYRRLAAGLPELRVINMFVETAATSQDGVVMFSRPGLVEAEQRGNGPIRGLFHQAGTLNDVLLSVSGAEVYGDGLLGRVGGAGAVSFAASAAEAIIAAGAAIVRTDGATVADVSFPDGADVIAVAYLGGYFIAVRDESQRFYWSKLRDATSWDGLDYASAESSPDPLYDVVVTGDIMWLLGGQTVEPWTLTGDSILPFSRVEGRIFQRGVLATGCADELDGALYWVGDDRRVYRSGGAMPEPLSDPGIEERIAAASAVSVFSFEYEGHKFLAVRLDTETVLFDATTGEWCEFASFGRPNWRARCAVQYNGVVRFGDDSAGQLWRFDVNAYADDAVPMQKLFTAFQPVTDGSYTLDVIHLDADFGSTPTLQGQGADPIAELRTSRDGGRTWTDWRQSSLGRQGQYRARAVWRRFGSFDAPGGIFEIRCSDPVRFRVSAVRANEAQGGRSR
ncbi:packaged DNA stabilization protein [Sphingomonas melonis]|uniref:Uncharacterized protein n=1 Tax=Sphingomonas melonis TaxID=152682 RepID=A0A7Y9FK07_9SPHN|nr:packaged DNA stabilization protein [Sphingomonas melonis]NYD88749.1 hypothetical protein [Sphingomonas melonis]